MSAPRTAATLSATLRTEFGKGAARRTRRAGNVPAVLYGHGTDPVHLALPYIDFARVLRDNGTNAVVTITADGSDHLALVRTVVVDPLLQTIQHSDLLVIRRGEKVVVEVNVVITGEAAAGTLVTQDLNSLEVEADVMSIPEELSVSVEDLEVGTQILAGAVELPTGVTLETDPEYLVVNVVAAPTAEELEEELDTEGAGVVEDEAESEEGSVSDDEPDSTDATEAEQKDG